MLHYIAVGPLARSAQRTELLGSGRRKGAAAASAIPQLLCHKLQKVCVMKEAETARTERPLSWLDKVNGALENWSLPACLPEVLCGVRKVI